MTVSPQSLAISWVLPPGMVGSGLLPAGKSNRGKRSGRKGIETSLRSSFEVQDEQPREMDDTNVLSMAISNIFAGSDTTAILLRSIIHHLLKDPDCKEEFIVVIDERKKQGTISDPVTLMETESMPYLQACMYEGLRLHPPVDMSLPHVVPEGGIEIDGKFIPSGHCHWGDPVCRA